MAYKKRTNTKGFSKFNGFKFKVTQKAIKEIAKKAENK